MTSPYDELNKRHEELAEQARAKEAEKLKSVPEKETPASGMRFEELNKAVADEKAREENRREALNEFPKAKDQAIDPHFSPNSANAPMRVHADRDHEGVYPTAKPPQERAPAKQGGVLQPTPGGTETRPAAAPQRRDPWAGPPPRVLEAQATTDRAEPTRQQDPWDRNHRVEMTDGRQAAQNREATREVTDRKLRNPFDREADDRAQRLVNTIAARSKEGRGRD
jgi:hypothetical protein